MISDDIIYLISIKCFRKSMFKPDFNRLCLFYELVSIILLGFLFKKAVSLSKYKKQYKN